MPTRQSYDDAYKDDAPTVLTSTRRIAAYARHGRDITELLREHYQHTMPPINRRRIERERV
jgi:hypothetical protein